MDELSKERLFGELAIELGFVTEGDLQRAVSRQKVDAAIGIKKPIGAYFFEDGKLNKQQVEKILRIQEKVIEERIRNLGTAEQSNSQIAVGLFSENETANLAGLLFREYSAHIENIKSTGDLTQILALIHPDTARQILANALSTMVAVVCQEATNRGQNYNQEEVANFCLSEGHYFRSFFDVYTNEYSQFQATITNYEENHNNQCYGAGLIGGVIGSILLGPLGAIAGGALAGGMAGNNMGENLKAQYDHLIQSYSKLLDLLNALIINLGDRGIHLINSVRQKN